MLDGSFDRQFMGQGQMGMGQGQMGMDQGSLAGDMNLANDISRAIIGEVHAYNFYQRLAQLADTEQNRRVILSIQRDEAKHYHWFTMMLNRMGIPLPQIPPGEMPVDFKQGVRKAISDELEAAAFYQDIAYRATSHMVQMHFMHASHDEQRHASWFQFMLSNMR